MPGFDYAAWVGRAQAFIHDLERSAEAKVHSSVIAPPASDEDVATVEVALGAALPSSLREFFTRGAAGLDYRYTFEPSDEALNRLREIFPHQRHVYGGVRDFLRAWEGLCYLGPEHWLLLEFVGPDGYLDANSDHVARLRGLFGR